MIETHLPSGLRRLSIFEDFNQKYVPGRHGAMLLPDPVRIVDSRVSAALAHRSLELEQLSASFMADAVHFFEARQTPWIWNRLQSLALTSQLLIPSTNPWEISDLLQTAGQAALSMPALHTMALWNVANRDACLFIYRRESGNPSITWRGTWDVTLDTRVVQAWKTVAAKYSSLELRLEKQSCRSVSSHGRAIKQLDLPFWVIHPVSLWQKWWESSTRRRPAVQ
jgi:hypothetical protein